MLRIKKDVDLKELEKFGFTKSSNYKEDDFYIGSCFGVVVKNRVLNQFDDIWGEDVEEFFDLIQSGIVEKVSEGENE